MKTSEQSVVPRSERQTGLQLDIVAIVKATQIARGQAASAARGEMVGKSAEASYNAAVRTSNDLWEWSEAMRTELNYAMRVLREASEKGSAA